MTKSPIKFNADNTSFLPLADLEQLDWTALSAARQKTLDDVDLYESGKSIPGEKQPLDAGYINWPQKKLDEIAEKGNDSEVAKIEACAERVRSQVDSLVVLGIGGSYMGMRAIFEALCDPYHNLRSRESRSEIPRLFFEGNNVDSTTLRSLLSLLEEQRAAGGASAEGRTGVVVISKSGGTMETAVAFRLFRKFLEKHDSKAITELIVPVTGEKGKLRTLSSEAKFKDIFDIPDGIGGRFSVLTAVGLVPAAIMGISIRDMLQGAADVTTAFREQKAKKNTVMRYVAACHAVERHYGMDIRVLSTWGNRLEAVGLWYDQLLAESLGKHDRGATPLTVVNTRDLHSRGQQHQEGTRDRIVTNLYVDSEKDTSLKVPKRSDDADQLNQHAGKSLDTILHAALQGTNKAYRDVERPTADMTMSQLDAYHLGALFQTLMLTTTLEGLLVGTNPYGQPGVEDYKRNMTEILKQS